MSRLIASVIILCPEGDVKVREMAHFPPKYFWRLRWQFRFCSSFCFLPLLEDTKVVKRRNWNRLFYDWTKLGICRLISCRQETMTQIWLQSIASRLWRNYEGNERKIAWAYRKSGLVRFFLLSEVKKREKSLSPITILSLNPDSWRGHYSRIIIISLLNAWCASSLNYGSVWMKVLKGGEQKVTKSLWVLRDSRAQNWPIRKQRRRPFAILLRVTFYESLSTLLLFSCASQRFFVRSIFAWFGLVSYYEELNSARL